MRLQFLPYDQKLVAKLSIFSENIQNGFWTD
jgi:hypothetical protein